VFAARTGRPLGHRAVLRGQLVVGADGDFILAQVKRRELRLPSFHALRHGAAMDCDDAEEARDLLRH
jgi:hypothetical protein